MPPIDDELRAALTGRAELLTPAADPFAGIERRARTIKRNRGFAAIVSTAAAVALVAVAVPAVIGGSTVTSRGPVATTGEPTPAPTSDKPAGALDWPVVTEPASYQAIASLLDGTRRLWATEHSVQAADVRGEVLYVGFTDEKRTVLAQQLWSGSTPAYVVISTTGEQEAILLHDEKAVAGINGYRAIVPGSATGIEHVVVIGAPQVTAIAYAAGGKEFVQKAAERTVVFRRTVPTGGQQDVVRFVLDGGSTDQPADPSTGDDGGSKPGGVQDAPSNVVDWPLRGTPTEGPDLDEAKAALAKGYGVPLEKAVFRTMFAGSSDGGLRYVYGQFWEQGSTIAYSAGYVTGGESGPEAILQRATPGDAQVLAFVPCCSPGTTTDTLVVIPAPGAGQVQYGAAGSEWRDVGAGQDYLDGVVLIDRDPRATDDRLRLLDGNGRVTFEGAVASLLCGVKSCG